MFLAARFWTKVNKLGPIPPNNPSLGNCWNWTGAKKNRKPHQYGHLKLNGRFVGAHRAAFLIAGIEIPADSEPDHICNNKLCVRLSHMELVTHKENNARSTSLSALNARKTHCPAGHLYDEANTYVDKDGSRHCRTCGRIGAMRRRKHTNDDTQEFPQSDLKCY